MNKIIYLTYFGRVKISMTANFGTVANRTRKQYDLYKMQKNINETSIYLVRLI